VNNYTDSGTFFADTYNKSNHLEFGLHYCLLQIMRRSLTDRYPHVSQIAVVAVAKDVESYSRPCIASAVCNATGFIQRRRGLKN